MTPAGMTEWGGERALVRATLRVNCLIFAAIAGLTCGLTVLAVILMAAVLPQSHAGLVVALLSVFMPGTAVGLLGACLGFTWGFVIGGIFGGTAYWLHSRHALNGGPLLLDATSDPARLPNAALRLDGSSLGVALGALGAVALVAATNWLVLRGSAAASPRARLLAEIFPGYSIDLVGSLIGAVQLFVVTYLLSRVFAGVYNTIAAKRRARH